LTPLIFGGGFSYNGLHYSLSIGLIADSNGTSGILITPEIGIGTPGAGLFARGLYGAGDNTFDTLVGLGFSSSLSLGRFSSSVSFPLYQGSGCDAKGEYETLGSYPPVFELGYGLGRSQLTGTIGNSFQYGRNTTLGDIGNSVGSSFYEFFH